MRREDFKGDIPIPHSILTSLPLSVSVLRTLPTSVVSCNMVCNPRPKQIISKQCVAIIFLSGFLWLPLSYMCLSHERFAKKTWNPLNVVRGHGLTRNGTYATLEQASPPGKDEEAAPAKVEQAKSGPFESHNLRDVNMNMATLAQKIYLAQTPETKLLSCIPPKNGCTYHISLQFRISGVEQWDRTNVIHNTTKKREMSLSSFPHDHVREWLESEEVPKYMVFRNPIERTLSAYLNKIQKFLPEDERTVEHFEEWVRREFTKGRTKSKRLRDMNPHWMPQVKMCGFEYGLHKYFKIFRFEDPAEVVEYIYETVPRKYLDDGWGKVKNVSFREFLLAPRERTEGTSDKLVTYFRSLETFDYLAEELRADIDELGYRNKVQEMRRKLVDTTDTAG